MCAYSYRRITATHGDWGDGGWQQRRTPTGSIYSNREELRQLEVFTVRLQDSTGVKYPVVMCDTCAKNSQTSCVGERMWPESTVPRAATRSARSRSSSASFRCAQQFNVLKSISRASTLLLFMYCTAIEILRIEHSTAHQTNGGTVPLRSFTSRT